MRTTLARTGGYTIAAEATPMSAPAGATSIAIFTTWDQARRPHEARRVLQLNLDEHGLRALRDLVDDALAGVRR